MRQSTSSQSEADARRAAERLKEARDLLQGMRQQQTATNMEDLSHAADDLARRQQESNNKMRRSFGSPGQQGQGATPQRAEELAREKDQIANDYQKLESDIGKTARDTQATNRQLSSKLRDALGEVQQNELNNRMRWTADHIRRGDGEIATMRDSVTTQALNKLRDQLRRSRSRPPTHSRAAQATKIDRRSNRRWRRPSICAKRWSGPCVPAISKASSRGKRVSKDRRVSSRVNRVNRRANRRANKAHSPGSRANRTARRAGSQDNPGACPNRAT
jgi:hypothetical protein